MLVDFWESNYAPMMIQARIVNARTLRRVLAAAEANGRPETEEDTVLLTIGDAEDLLGARRVKEIAEGWDLRARIEDDTARNLYGYLSTAG